MGETVWVNGECQANVSAFDRGLAYGDGLFATMRCHKGGVRFLDTHLNRLAQGTARLGIDWHVSDRLRQQIADVCQQGMAQFEADFCLKLLLSRGVGGRGYLPPSEPLVTLVFSLHEIPNYYRRWQQLGINLQSSEVKLSLQPLLAGIKHLNRLEQVLVRSQILEEPFDDWLVLDGQDNIVEASMANLFFIRAKRVVTPSLQSSGVSGVMREQLIYWFISAGFDLELRPLSKADLIHFDHVVASNSLFGVVGVNRIDDHSFSPCPLVAKILQDLSLAL